ncbi:Peptidoglycan/xylan/chitin deacetylase, PgdA/CDA1 family [Paenibacillus uliginis N3/975]|uniref:Peptidoglycan/xylan/chitin deacetylase, PgdA/CDA1 family n=1 Tax=Paenibacillus uliginis N3/975 TaxID=1313296 RepID=A0A1X7HR92_9BACL|nr:polysaccharide deacetylase [Paenibacillus uliginis]SMF90624.1 Peptidoglycan/xylan/chitin deacetylase, PgdA/CDA1 family [Paenibacillus uliginis N3/975]
MYKNVVIITRIALLFVLAAVLILTGFMTSLQPGHSLINVSLAEDMAEAAPFTAEVHNASEATVYSGAVSVSTKSVLAPATAVKEKKHSAKTVYLTFDDGPSGLTGEVLDILKKSGIKATFFVLGEQAAVRPELIARIFEEGHAIGNHTYNHEYNKLYEKFQEFWRQVKQTEETIRLITGVRPQLVRAPGGTAGKFDETYFRLLKQGGYQVFDWNVDSGDSKRRGVPAEEILKGATTPVSGNEAIVLLHDGAGHEETVKALPGIIAFYKEKGYNFDVLTPEMEPVQFKLHSNVKTKQEQPGSRWIAENVAHNAALFKQGRTLAVDMGGLATEFAPGEYRMENGKFMVPLRSAVERLGGGVFWKAESRTVQVSLTDARWEADPIKGTMTLSGIRGKTAVSEVKFIGHTVWVPIRDVLEISGHPVKDVVSGGDVYRIVTL